MDGRSRSKADCIICVVVLNPLPSELLIATHDSTLTSTPRLPPVTPDCGCVVLVWIESPARIQRRRLLYGASSLASPSSLHPSSRDPRPVQILRGSAWCRYLGLSSSFKQQSQGCFSFLREKPGWAGSHVSLALRVKAVYSLF